MQLSNNEYKTIATTIKKIYKEGGITNYYKGMTSNIIKIIPNNGIRFLMYEIFKNLITN